MPPRPRTLAVEYRDLDALRPAKRNPRLHDLPAIRASLQRFGLGDVAGIVDARTDRLVAGHGRIEALADMRTTGDQPPEGVHVTDGAWRVPVLVGARFRNATEAEAFLVGHNRTTELGGWDPEGLAAVLERSRPGAAWFVCAPSGPLFLQFATVLNEWDVWRQTILWVKDRMVMGRSDYHYRHEAIFAGATPGAPVELYDPDDADSIVYGWAPGAAHTTPPTRRETTVWEFPRPTASKVHPTMKPVDLVAHAIRNHTRPGDLVLDPFAGSGSTLIAAQVTGRVASVIEVDPGYCDVIARRYQQTSGDVPCLDGTPTDLLSGK